MKCIVLLSDFTTVTSVLSFLFKPHLYFSSGIILFLVKSFVSSVVCSQELCTYKLTKPDPQPLVMCLNLPAHCRQLAYFAITFISASKFMGLRYQSTHACGNVFSAGDCPTYLHALNTIHTYKTSGVVIIKEEPESTLDTCLEASYT